MGNIKDLFGFCAILLTFGNYLPYFQSIILGKTKPHVFSWLVWLLDATIIFGLQLSHGAGVGSLATLAAAVMCFLVLFFGFVRKSRSEIKIVDVIFLILALFALVIWLVAKQPVISAILITLVDLFGFAPTVRKSWNKPFSELPVFYATNTIRFSLAILALSEYSLITIIYPLAWFFANGLFALMLLVRRRQI